MGRIDIYLEVYTSAISEIINSKEAEDSATVAKKVEKARTIQLKRYQNTAIRNNS